MSKSKYTGVYPAVSKVKDPVTGEVKDIVLEGKWCLRLCYTVNGKTYRETETIEAKTQKQAYDAKVRLITDRTEQIITGGNISKAKKMNFAELVKDWETIKKVEIEKGKFSPTTFATYQSTLDKYVLSYFGNMIIENINSATIYTYMDYINGQYSLSEKTLRNQLMLISGIFTYAKDRGLINNHPFDKVNLESLPIQEASYFNDQQIVRIFKQLDQDVIDLIESFGTSIKYKKLEPDERERRQNIRLLDVMSRRLFVHLAFVTGARRGEIISTTWSQLDMDEMEVEFNGTSYTLAGEQTKKKSTLKNGSKSKVVSFNDQLVPLIIEYKKLQKKVRKQNGWRDNGYVFLATHKGKIANPGDPMRGDTMTQWFHSWCIVNKKQLGLTDAEANEAHVHMLRHSSITFGMMAGVPMKILSKRAGHSSVAVTQKIYAHVSSDAQKSVANQFNKIYDMRSGKVESVS